MPHATAEWLLIASFAGMYVSAGFAVVTPFRSWPTVLIGFNTAAILSCLGWIIAT